MNSHSASFPAVRAVSGGAVQGLLPNTSGTAAVDETTAPPAAARKFSVRRLLRTGATLALVCGAAWYGWDYWTMGQYLVSTDDAYIKADIPAAAASKAASKASRASCHVKSSPFNLDLRVSNI